MSLRAAVLTSLCVGALWLTGCELLSLTAATVAGSDKVPAKHELADVRTAVIVDDPLNLLGDPSLKSVVATNVIFYLQEEEVLTAPPVTSQEIGLVAKHLGSRYNKMPLGEIGELVKADQIIHVQITSVTREYAPGVFRPTAEYLVKVLDVVNRKRVFPEAPAMRMNEGPEPGELVVSEMRTSTTQDQGLSEIQALDRKLAARIGRDASRLFYAWKTPPVGRRFEDD